MHVDWKHLFEVFMQQVAVMRQWQETQSRAFPERCSPYITELEREVDQLIQLHQMETPDQLAQRVEQLAAPVVDGHPDFVEEFLTDEEMKLIAQVATPCIRFCRALAVTLDSHNPNVEDWLHSVPMDDALRLLEDMIE